MAYTNKPRTVCVGDHGGGDVGSGWILAKVNRIEASL